MSNQIEFLVSEAIPAADGFVVRGIGNFGTIVVNDVFMTLIRDEGNIPSVPQLIELRVTEIIAYRHNIDELPSGMSAELRCVGTAAGDVASNDLLQGKKER